MLETLVRGSHGRGHEDDAVSAHKQHGDGSLGRLEHLLVRLLVDLGGGDGLLHVAQDHVQMVVIGLQKNKDSFGLLTCTCTLNQL